MKKQIKPEVDYRRLLLGTLKPEETRHLWLLLYWPIYGAFFFFVEKMYRPDGYYSVWCPLDDAIPFCELFLIPYLFWFVYLIGMHVYTLIYDVAAFRKMMYFIMITYSATIIIYLIFPTCQDLRPAEFEKNNFLTRFMAEYYAFDTNTNVCPSIHVIGSLAVMLTSFHCKDFGRATKIAFAITGILIALSTVFVKQHSVIDLAAALPICILAYYLSFKLKRKPNG
ncbi:MAG: phosphatidic acid phosphatase [Clostridia bacterium]|nr:phosphatidic acid phosphatase [Clostridia bacterium]